MCIFEQVTIDFISMKNKQVFFSDLGLQEYIQTFDFQQQQMDVLIQQKAINRDLKEPFLTDNYFYFVEHPHVYTLGRSGDKKNLLISEGKLKAIKATFVHSNRGGDITYHGPGQLVGYPILDLDNFSTDIIKYLRNLEDVIIRVLAEYGLEGARSEGETGVWLEVGTPLARKICALGVKTSKWVTMHGFALNVSTDLTYFDQIVPCGIRDKKVTSLLAELGEKAPSMKEVKTQVKRHFEIVFEVKLINKLEILR